MSALHAVRVAARLRRELGVSVDEIAGRYGEFTVLVGGEPVLQAGPFGWLGVLPTANEVIGAVRGRLRPEA